MSLHSSFLIDAETRLMGLIGEGISHSLSPLMHNRAAQTLRQNIAYLPLAMPQNQIPGFLEAAWHLGAVGFNVTKPHKGFVASLLGSGAPQSVNTLYRGQTGWLGTSTDGSGFARALEKRGRPLSSFDRIVMMGNGGAALAILEYFATQRDQGEKVPSRVNVLRRTEHRDPILRGAIQGAANLKTLELTPRILATQLAGAGEETLLVQATSAPLHGASLSEFTGALDDFHGALVDLVYGRPSALYFRAVAMDLVAQDGEAMLIEQALLSQEIWWGTSALYEDMALALRRK